jgi:hypothetical protein
MNVGVLAWLALCSSVLGCANGSPPAATHPPLSSSAKSIEIEPAAAKLQPKGGPPSACSEIERSWQKRMSEARRDAEIDQSLLDSLPSALGRCLDAKTGTWAVVLDAIAGSEHSYPGSQESQPGLRAVPNIVFATTNGRTELPLEANWSIHGVGQLELELVVQDWNRDGTSELGMCHDVQFQVMMMPVTFRQHGCEIYRFDAKEKKIEPIAPVAIERFKDVDSDGVLDIVTFDPFQIVGHSYSTDHCSMCLDEDLNGPELVAHALPDGSFSRTDALAVASARRACPKPAPVSFPKKCGDEEFGRGWRDFACAQLWGENRQTLRRAAESARKQCCPDPSYCPEVDRLDEWAATPPLPAILRAAR